MFDTFTILDIDITAAVSATAVTGHDNLYAMQGLAMAATFDSGSGGTSVKVYIQTSLDEGATWIDVCCFAFTTSDLVKVANLSGRTPVTTPFSPTDGALGDNTVKDGVLGDRVRVKYVTTGTYTGANLKVYVTPKP